MSFYHNHAGFITIENMYDYQQISEIDKILLALNRIISSITLKIEALTCKFKNKTYHSAGASPKIEISKHEGDCDAQLGDEIFENIQLTWM